MTCRASGTAAVPSALDYYSRRYLRLSVWERGRLVRPGVLLASVLKAERLGARTSRPPWSTTCVAT